MTHFGRKDSAGERDRPGRHHWRPTDDSCGPDREVTRAWFCVRVRSPHGSSADRQACLPGDLTGRRHRVFSSLVEWFVRLSLVCRLLCQQGLSGEEAPPVGTHGLSVRDGVVMLDGKPFRGIGSNYFALFSRLLKNPEDTSSLSNLTALAKSGIPFVRFMCGGYWPAEQRLYLDKPDAFFERLDRVVRNAEKNHIGLVPSLFWHLPTLPDLAGEPVQELGNTNSRTIALLRRYTAEVVNRYKDSPAIWAWEFGNESALGADLPNASEHRPPVVPGLGTAKTRSSRDELSFAGLRIAYAEFAGTIRKLDPTRVIISGNALPRDSAWHNTHERSWKADTAEQFCEILRRDNPGLMNVLSVHIYRTASHPGGARSIDDIVALVAEESEREGKPAFVGEFGVERQTGTLEQQRAAFEELLAAFERHRVPLAAFWVFDYPAMEADWNVSFQNDRAFMIGLVARANARIRSGAR